MLHIYIYDISSLRVNIINPNIFNNSQKWFFCLQNTENLQADYFPHHLQSLFFIGVGPRSHSWFCNSVIIYLFLLFAYQSYFDFQTFPIFVFEISTDFTLAFDLRCVFWWQSNLYGSPEKWCMSMKWHSIMYWNGFYVFWLVFNFIERRHIMLTFGAEIKRYCPPRCVQCAYQRFRLTLRLLMSYIQGVPGGICQTSAGCSLC